MGETKVSLLLSGVPESTARAVEDALHERHRQIHEEGWTLEHDDGHATSELPLAAAAYALSSTEDWSMTVEAQRLWPFEHNPKHTTPRRDLIKAIALLIAEVERLDRAKQAVR